MPRRRRDGTRRGQRGASLVEFALIVPLLSMFLFGIVQFGIAYDKKQSINSAAREGARLGALETTDVSEIRDRAVGAYISAASGPDPTVTVTGVIVGPPAQAVPFASGDGPCASTTPKYDFVRVSVMTPYDITIPFFGVQPITIDAEAEFRCE